MLYGVEGGSNAAQDKSHSWTVILDLQKIYKSMDLLWASFPFYMVDEQKISSLFFLPTILPFCVPAFLIPSST